MFCRNTKIFIPGIPKCGSTAIDRYFACFGAIEESQHTSVEIGVKNFVDSKSEMIRYKILVTRDPIDRFQSIYEEFLKYHDHPMTVDAQKALDDFEYFFELTNKIDHIHWRSVYENANFANIDYHVISLQNLNNGLNKYNREVMQIRHEFNIRPYNVSKKKAEPPKSLRKKISDRYKLDQMILESIGDT